ncbi:MAG: hypothetical protein LBT80_06490 [Lactobacillaceae bacterium]|nr:hypothetical protein [Lactobacillaceae bacterium]
MFKNVLLAITAIIIPLFAVDLVHADTTTPTIEEITTPEITTQGEVEPAQGIAEENAPIGIELPTAEDNQVATTPTEKELDVTPEPTKPSKDAEISDSVTPETETKPANQQPAKQVIVSTTSQTENKATSATVSSHKSKATTATKTATKQVAAATTTESTIESTIEPVTTPQRTRVAVVSPTTGTPLNGPIVETMVSTPASLENAQKTAAVLDVDTATPATKGMLGIKKITATPLSHDMWLPIVVTWISGALLIWIVVFLLIQRRQHIKLAQMLNKTANTN